MSEGLWVAVGGAVGAIIAALVAGVVAIINTWHKNNQETRASQFTEQSAIIDRQEKQISRLESQIVEQQKAITEIQKMHAECREAAAEQRMYLMLLFEYAKRLHMLVKTDHPDMEPPPDLPPARKWRDDVDFIAKSQAANTNLVVAIDAKMKSVQPGAA